MPLGTGALQSSALPVEPYIIDPDGFFSMTKKMEHQVETYTAPAGGQSWQRQLPQTGVISRLVTTFVGTITVAVGGATPGNRWPYGYLDSFVLGANGQSQLWNVSGEDLHVRRAIRYPAYVEQTDVFPGDVGGGAAISAGTYDMALTWEVDIAADDTSLVGALYAQSAATNLTLDRRVATAAQLFSANDTNVTIDGTFYTSITRFSIPRSPAEGNPLLIPDLTRLHGVNAIELDYSGTGAVTVNLVRAAGQLHRLFVSAEKSPGNRLSADPATAAASKIDRLRLLYGAGEVPYDYNPAWVLQSRNNDHYGYPAPYDRLVLDMVRENAPRDVIFLQGVTELKAEVTVNAAATVAGGRIRLVQETLF